MFTYIRNHFHPLWRLRRFRWFRRLQGWLDFPVSKKFGKIRVQVFWLRDLSYLLLPDDSEQKTGSCFDAVLAKFEPTCFLDIGANIGAYSWRVYNLTDQVDIWMFEPDVKNAELVARTIARNKLERVTLYPVAVSEQSGVLQFLIDSVSGTTGSLSNQASNRGSLHHAYDLSETRDVTCINLDSLEKKLERQKVLIKIDVEGAEDGVLRGARNILRHIRPVIFVECFDLEKLGWLADFDYHIRDLKEGGNYLAFPSELEERVKDEWRLAALS